MALGMLGRMIVFTTKARKVQTELSLEVQLGTVGVDGMDGRMEGRKAF